MSVREKVMMATAPAAARHAAISARRGAHEQADRAEQDVAVTFGADAPARGVQLPARQNAIEHQDMLQPFPLQRPRDFRNREQAVPIVPGSAAPVRSATSLTASKRSNNKNAAR